MKVVHFDRSSHFGRSDRNAPFHLTKCKREGLGRVCATRMYRSIGQIEFPKFQTEVFVEWKALHACWATRRMNQARKRTASNTLLIHAPSNLYIKMAASGLPSSCNTGVKVTLAELASPGHLIRSLLLGVLPCSLRCHGSCVREIDLV